MRYSRVATGARYLLGAIRLTNGTAALLVPRQFANRVGMDAALSPTALYFMRMFGVRTVVIGAQLILLEDEELEAVLRPALLIHATDALAAALAGRTGQMPRRAARTALIISSVNVALSLLARRRSRR